MGPFWQGWIKVPTSESEQETHNVWLGHDTEQYMSESELEAESVGAYRYSLLWNNNPHWHAQELWLGTDLFGILRGCPSWDVVPTGAHRSENGGSDLGWTWLQSPLACMWTGY